MSNICLAIPDDLIARIDSVAAEEQRSRSAMIRRMVTEHLKWHAELCQADHTAGIQPSNVRPEAPPDARAAAEGHLQRHAQLSRTGRRALPNIKDLGK